MTILLILQVPASGISDVFVEKSEQGHMLQMEAENQRQAEQYDKAIETSTLVMQVYKNEGYAIWAGLTMMKAQLQKGDVNSAQGTVTNITNDYANDPGFAQVISIAADAYCEQKMNDDAYNLRQIIIRRFPESIWGKQAEILVLLNQNAYSIAQKRLDALIEDFNQNTNLSEVVFRVGQEFCWKRKYSDAKGIFDRIQNISDSSFKQRANLWSVAANTCALIRQNKDEEAASDLSAMIKDFEKEQMLPEVVYRTAQEFEWTKGEVAAMSSQYNLSVSVYSQVLQSFSVSKYAKMSQEDCVRLKYRIDILSAIEKDNESEANAAIDKMTAEYAGRPELENELYWLEGWCRDNGKDGMADSINKRRSQK
jgi:tetratricopeptide (TPR) repeat protein